MNRTIYIRLNAILVPAFILMFILIFSQVRGAAQVASRDEAVKTAKLIMASSLAVREYTVEKVKPMIESKYSFSPLTVSSFAAVQTLGIVAKQYPDYHYREATLNPTNPLDRAEDWEADIVRHFRQNSAETEFVSEHNSITGSAVVIARPLKIGNAACLDCHSTPDRAPKEMTAMYPAGGGFGWQLNEIVGAQIVTVPIALAQTAISVGSTLLVSVGVGLLVLLLIVNLGVYLFVPRSGAVAKVGRQAR